MIMKPLQMYIDGHPKHSSQTNFNYSQDRSFSKRQHSTTRKKHYQHHRHRKNTLLQPSPTKKSSSFTHIQARPQLIYLHCFPHLSLKDILLSHQDLALPHFKFTLTVLFSTMPCYLCISTEVEKAQ